MRMNTKKIGELHLKMDQCLEMDQDCFIPMFERLYNEICLRECVIGYHEFTGIPQEILWDAYGLVKSGVMSVKEAAQFHEIDQVIVQTILNVSEREN